MSDAGIGIPAADLPALFQPFARARNAVARGMGMAAEAVKGVDEFRPAFARAVAAEGPVLLDIDMSALHPMGGIAAMPRRA